MNFNNWLYLEKNNLNIATSEQLGFISKLEKEGYLEDISNKETLTKEEAKHLIEIGLQEKQREEMERFYDWEF